MPARAPPVATWLPVVTGWTRIVRVQHTAAPGPKRAKLPPGAKEELDR